ncbi:MAG: bile acid:sodium symporter [Candidatus Adiutrix intracellularis]|jgi:ACR3 family arsenite efflux pump ArsB|nr:bile acid:sodium symporter [Candidatus Adiutrix intracellularis]
MSLFERLQTIFMLGAITLGLVGGQSPFISARAGSLIIPALMAMLFGLFLSIPLTNLKKSFFNVKFTVASLSLNFIWVPFLGWVLGGLFLADHPDLRIGYIMLLVTPCIDWYLVFTGLAKGNVELSAAILPLNLIIQVILLPVYLFLFTGLMGYVDFKLLLKSIFLVLIIPFGLAQFFRFLFKDKKRSARWFLSKIFSGGQFIFLCLAIAAMFASQAPYLVGNVKIFLLLAPVLLFFGINFLVGRLVAKILRFSFEDSVSLNLTTLARNSPISLAIAVTAFPNEPLIALALVIGPLIELPFLAVITQVLLWMYPACEKKN